MVSNTSEKDFQNEIIDYFLSTGYVKQNSNSFSKEIAIDAELTLKFIKATQKKEWKKFERIYKDNPEVKFLYRLANELENKGTLHILRNGFKDVGAYFKLFYPMPNNKKNPDLFENYEKNIFSIIDELEYQEGNSNRIDLAIFINGLPIATIELKDTFSQGVENAIAQYKNDRDPRDKIFNRCLVHFAMSDEKIFMTTKLAGENTRFLPFNKELNNPEVPNDYKTSYLYKDILQINKLSKLIANFIFDEEDITIFPRYHQLDCVNLLLEDISPGKNYLIQHSAGSGKTKTIAWLAHGLINRFDEDDQRIYDMVIVISDRKVIDKQLQDQIKAIEKAKGTVEVIDKDSKQLAESLKTGSNIVVTTLQKFPHILEETKNISNRKYAVIIDEAHSSQTGSFARSMKQVLSSRESEENLDEVEDFEDEILNELESFKDLSNISFFAFTATPKNKTLEMFGSKNDLGEYYPFHEYTMKQAIEEGFILDVLKNYLTYATYFKLVKTIEEDPEFNKKKAQKVLRKFVEKHPQAISIKTDIILDHFMNSTYYKIKNKARAMLVTGSREQAVLYKKEFDKQIKEKGFPIKTLVAFTGTIKHDMQEYTENSMNELSKESIVETFKKEPYKILIVANKFQTGFDEPLLHTMYVDKVLTGITAVQTLSRVNRIHKNKNNTLVLDFANKTETIQKAFQPYYESTYLKEATDHHKLYNLWDKLLDYYIFDKDDIDTFVKAYKKGSSQPKLHNLLNAVVDEFKKLTKGEQVDFKKDLRRYQSMYSFLSQLMPFTDVNLEKLFIFNKFLNKKLPTINNPLPFNVLEDVDMDSYKVEDKGETSISLTGEGELSPISDNVSKYRPEEKAKLSQILKKLNDAFGTDFSDENKVFLKQVKDNMLANEELANKIANNSKENVEAIFDKYFDQEMLFLLQNNLDFFKKISDNENLKNKLRKELLDLVYEEKKKQVN